MTQDDNNSKQPKNLYKIEFWQQNNDGNPDLPPVTLLDTKYVYAYSAKQAIAKLKVRALKNARTLGRPEDHELVSMFHREDISINTQQTTDTRVLDRIDKDDMREDVKSKANCKECGDPLDDDYCQSCGWRRQSWLERAMSKQGKTETVGEQ